MSRATDAQKNVKDLANERANERMRQEILPELREVPAADLGHGWHPWETDPAPIHAHSLKTTDKLVYEVMADDDKRERARDMIHEETVAAAFFSEHTPEFLGGVLEDLLGVSDKPIYKAHRG